MTSIPRMSRMLKQLFEHESVELARAAGLRQHGKLAALAAISRSAHRRWQQQQFAQRAAKCLARLRRAGGHSGHRCQNASRPQGDGALGLAGGTAARSLSASGTPA